MVRVNLAPFDNPFLSTPSARRATACQSHLSHIPLYFYPRPPRGGRPSKHLYGIAADVFLSTPSARRATLKVTSRAV